MAVLARSVSWEKPADRKASAVWLGLIWLAVFAGFGLDMRFFFAQNPLPAGIIYLHAAIFVSWLVLVSLLVALILGGRVRLHRRVGKFGATIAIFMVLLGVATSLTFIGEYHFHPGLLALNLVDLLGFIAFIGLGILYRNHPAAHKRLMVLAMISLAGDGAFGRITQNLLPVPHTVSLMFVESFYGNVLLVAAMFSWDLWRQRRVHPALLIGAPVLLAAEFVATILYFNPAWNATATSIVHAWGYTGGMP